MHGHRSFGFRSGRYTSPGSNLHKHQPIFLFFPIKTCVKLGPVAGLNGNLNMTFLAEQKKELLRLAA